MPKAKKESNGGNSITTTLKLDDEKFRTIKIDDNEEIFPDEDVIPLGNFNFPERESKPELVDKVEALTKEVKKGNEIEELYKELENLFPKITHAISVGNAQGVYNSHKNILSKYKELFL